MKSAIWFVSKYTQVDPRSAKSQIGTNFEIYMSKFSNFNFLIFKFSNLQSMTKFEKDWDIIYLLTLYIFVVPLNLKSHQKSDIRYLLSNFQNLKTILQI